MTFMKPSQCKQTKSLGKEAKCLRVNNKTFAALPQKVDKVNAWILYLVRNTTLNVILEFKSISIFLF